MIPKTFDQSCKNAQSSHYNCIIEQQLQYKERYINQHILAQDVLSLQIQNNTIISAKWTVIHPKRKLQFMQMIIDIIAKFRIKDGFVNINVADFPINGCFNFCQPKNLPIGFLIPNHRFAYNDFEISSNSSKSLRNHDDIIRFFQVQNASIPFQSKVPKLFSNGGLWYDQRLEFVKYALDNLDVCDFYAHNHPVHKFGTQINTNDLQKIFSCGKGGSVHQPFDVHNQYKYILYVDGNALADRMRLLLMLNSVPIVLKSKWKEFYTDILVPYENFIPCERVTDIRSIVESLEKNPERSMRIIENNQKFVKEKFQYEHILKYAAELINGLL
jgi:hypothetical protein